MAVVDVKWNWKGGSATDDTQSRSATRIGTAKTDDTSDSPVTVKQSELVPKIGQAHPDDQWLRVKSVTPTQKAPYLYDLRVEYHAPHSSGDLDNPSGNPLDEPPKIKMSFVTSQEPIDEDISGNPIQNKVEEAFDPPITRDFSDLRITIERNEAFVNVPRILAYTDSVNSDKFFDFPAGTVRFLAPSADEVRQDQFVYWRHAYHFQARTRFPTTAAKAWYRRILNQGFRERTGFDLSGAPIYNALLDDSGNPVTQPVLLNDDGKRLKPNADPPEEPVWLEFQIYPALPFRVFAF